MATDDQAGMRHLEPLFTDGYLRLRRCRHGLMLYNLNDVYIGSMLDRFGEFSEDEVSVFRQFLRPGMTVVEVGANIGSHTVPIAQFVGPSGRVIAFEPQRITFQTLCANLALNRIENVRAYWAALGKEKGDIAVPPLATDAIQNFGGYSLEKARVGEQVRLATLDEFDLSHCHLLKIDVEGMEADVLRGGVETIRRHSPLIYLENDRREKSPVLIGTLFELGYRCYWHLPVCVSEANFRNEKEDIPRVYSVNMICLPRTSRISLDGATAISSVDDWHRYGSSSNRQS